MRVTLLVITIGIVVCAFGSVVSPVAAFTSLSQGSTPRLSQSPQSQPFPQRRCDTTFLRTTRTTAETPSTLRPLPTTSSHPVFAVVQDFQLKKPWKDGTTPLLQTRTCNIVLGQLTDSPRPDAAGAAERILRYMLQNAHAPGAPDVVSLNSVLACYSKLGSDKDARGRQQQRDAAEHSALDKAYADEHVHVDAAFLSNILYSLATCDEKDMPVFAEELVTTMTTQHGVDDSVLAVYNALIHCWAKSGERDAVPRVLAILRYLEAQTTVQPDIKTYTNVLDCLAKSRDRQSHVEAEALLQRMEELGPPPNVQAYTSLIQNFSRSRLPYKAVKASEILQRMKASANPLARPNVVTYNAVLNAAEHTDTSDKVATEEALKVACLTFDEIRSSTVRPNHVTYGTFLGVLANLMPIDSRHEIVSLVFRRSVGSF
ncbi:predicted protein [Phaeodactylum tricornutum CCAP 1055/1]|uniref:Uncharacterized protein n=2 Tax=Phaeodactylum tricornutum TaxID=2850 RepID=B7FUV9_PHATC|nr:predicted protein [Phaeodactylum tricornutum CCAP 1055/1]EEC50053.1 predicted protein [Phaeodactylum tricornutum CCAP 1055/1]|eukprot:XP_002178388.1 predicted protein [Phaeodactylum tricornutum CCAP 1055/1]